MWGKQRRENQKKITLIWRGKKRKKKLSKKTYGKKKNLRIL